MNRLSSMSTFLGVSFKNSYAAFCLRLGHTRLLTVRICRVVVEDRANGPVEATHDHKVTLVLWLSAETLLANRQEAAVFDRRGAVFTS